MDDIQQAPERKQLRFSLFLGRIWRDFWPYLLVLLFGMILTMGVWALGLNVMTGDDYAFHTMRMQSASKAWSNGQIVPQVDPDVLGGFGYAYNLFYGPLITYVAAGLQALVGFWPLAMNIALVLCLVGTGLTMCHTMLKISKNRALAVIISVFYMAAPYVLNNLYSRMALGEVVAAVAAPILLLGLYQLIAHEKHAARNIAISAALLVLSHSLSALLFGIVGVVFVILNLDYLLNIRSIWRAILGVLVALGLTAFFTLPMIEAKMEGNYGVFDAGYSEKYFGANAQSVNDHRLWPQQLFGIEYAGQTNSEGLSGEFGVTLGMMAMVGLFGFLFVRKWIEDRVERRWATTLYIISVLAILISLPIVNWGWMPGILLKVQFPWRFLMIAAVGLSVAGGYTVFALVRELSESKQAAVMVMASLLAIYFVMPTILPNENRHLESAEEATKDPVILGWQAEYLPMQLLCSPDDEEDLKQGYACGIHRSRELLAERGDGVRIVGDGGSGSEESEEDSTDSDEDVEVEVSRRDGLNFDLKVKNGVETSEVELPVVWYPGYKARLNGEELEVKASEKYGLVTVVVPAEADGTIVVGYGLSKATKIGAMISAVTAGLGLIWVVISGICDMFARKKRREMADLMDSVREAVEASEAEEQFAAEVEAMAAASERDLADDDRVMNESVSVAVTENLGLPMPPKIEGDLELTEKPKRGRRRKADLAVEAEKGERKGVRSKSGKASSKVGTTTAKTGATKATRARTKKTTKAEAGVGADDAKQKTATRTTRIKTTKVITKEPE